MDEKTRVQKLFSLSGVVPLGAFVVLHLWTAAALLGSHSAYDRQVGIFHGGLFFGLLEIVLILLPLLFHAGYGILLSLRPLSGDDSSKPHTYESNLMRALQRVTGILVLAFVVVHLWQTRVQTFTGHLLVGSYSTKLVEQLSTTFAGIPWVALGYLVGLAATIFHLVVGLNAFAITWNFTGSFAGRARARLLFRALGVLFFAASSATVLELATGTRFFAAERTTSVGVCGPAAAPSAAPSAHP